MPETPSQESLRQMAAAGCPRLPEVPGVSFPPGLDKTLPTPDQKACLALWDRYGVPEHIRNHSRQVTRVMLDAGELLRNRGRDLMPPYLLAGGLLHDLAKMYTIKHGGDHAQLGAAVVLRETRNPLVAQMVYHHVGWPWRVDITNDHALHVLLAGYADKRVQHDRIVSLEERFADLLERYGKTERSRNSLAHAFLQAKEIETKLSELLEVALHEYSFNSRRLV
ncbi:MAG: HDIG domain-containing protein [Deltaproteobacteria bacterium]|jgi:putative nucleotidyltransferase with HDIG domain|nr:HDIG domain-containing protein [Deltaproteobacteria bacterium]